MIAVIVSDSPIAIDIEEIKKRDISLLSRYPKSYQEILDPEGLTDIWGQFYRLWTLEESLYKLQNTTMEYPDFSLVAYQRETHSMMSQKNNYMYKSYWIEQDEHIVCVTQ